MTVEILALLALEEMKDKGLSKDKNYIRQDRTDSMGKYVDYYQSREDLKIGNPFLSISTNLDNKPMLVQHLYNFEGYKSAEQKD